MPCGPFQPDTAVSANLNMEHPVEQCRGHRPGDGVVLRMVACTDHDRTFGQVIFPDAAFQNKGIKCFLYFLRTGVQFVQKQAIGFFLRNHFRRAEHAAAIYDLRHTDNIFRRKLTAQQRNAGQSHICGELLYDSRLADAGCSPDKDRAHNANVQ